LQAKAPIHHLRPGLVRSQGRTLGGP
jgi:hypothetical protein